MCRVVKQVYQVSSLHFEIISSFCWDWQNINSCFDICWLHYSTVLS